MKQFSIVATQLNVERIKSLGNPSRSGFYPNRRGVMQRTIGQIPFCTRSNGRIKPLGLGLLCYSDQDSKEECAEAELVRSNRWASHQVGKLWAFINGKIINLAQIDPTGEKLLKSGFITEDGHVVIDIDKE
jgi:hypothetical protein